MENSGIDLLDDSEAFAACEVEFGESKECHFPRIGISSVGLLVSADEAGPHLAHCIWLRQRNAADTGTNKQISYDKPAQEFSGPCVGVELAQFGEGLNDYLYLAVGK